MVHLIAQFTECLWYRKIYWQILCWHKIADVVKNIHYIPFLLRIRHHVNTVTKANLWFCKKKWRKYTLYAFVCVHIWLCVCEKIYSVILQSIVLHETECVEWNISRPIIYVAFPMSNWLSLIFLTCHGFNRRWKSSSFKE